MKFTIDQIAICPSDPVAAKKLLSEMGAVEWAEDHVVAKGSIMGKEGLTNQADLSFNYDLLNGNEFEVLHYTRGKAWTNTPDRANSVSHLGMHVGADELEKWRAFFKERNVGVAQEVFTQSHTNPAIAGKRKYNYVIFDTKAILGVDLKFIVRLMLVEDITVECLVCGRRSNVKSDQFHGHAECGHCEETTNHIKVANE